MTGVSWSRAFQALCSCGQPAVVLASTVYMGSAALALSMLVGFSMGDWTQYWFPLACMATTSLSNIQLWTQWIYEDHLRQDGVSTHHKGGSEMCEMFLTPGQC